MISCFLLKIKVKISLDQTATSIRMQDLQHFAKINILILTLKLSKCVQNDSIDQMNLNRTGKFCKLN